MFAYGTADCERVDLVTGPGNVYVAAAKRLLRGVVGIDAEAGPTEIAILADDTADPRSVAADLIAQAEHDPIASCLLVTPSAELLDAVDRELGAQVAATRHRDRVETALRNQSAPSWSTTSSRGSTVVDAWAAEHLEVLTARRPRLGRPGRATPAPSSSAPTRRSRSATTSPAPTTSCRPAARRGTPAGCRCSRSCAACTSSSTTSGALAEAAAHIDALGGAEDLPAHVAAVRVRVPREQRSEPAVSDIEKLLREELRGRTPYGAPQLDVPVRLNTNENPHPPSAELVADLAAPGRRGGRGRSTATPTARPSRCAPTSPPTSPARPVTARCGAGLGGQRLQRGPPAAAAGVRRAGPHGARVRAVVLHAPPDLPGHRHRLPVDRRGARTSRSTPEAAALAVREHAPDVVFLCSPNNPTGTALDLDVVDAVYDGRAAGMVVVDEAYAEFSTRPSAVTLLPGRPTAGRHPHDVQGVRVRRRAGSATSRPTRASSTRCSWSGCPTTSRR